MALESKTLGVRQIFNRVRSESAHFLTSRSSKSAEIFEEKKKRIMKLENRLQKLLIAGLALSDTTNGQFGMGSSGPTSRVSFFASNLKLLL